MIYYFKCFINDLIQPYKWCSLPNSFYRFLQTLWMSCGCITRICFDFDLSFLIWWVVDLPFYELQFTNKTGGVFLCILYCVPIQVSSMRSGFFFFPFAILYSTKYSLWIYFFITHVQSYNYNQYLLCVIRCSIDCNWDYTTSSHWMDYVIIKSEILSFQNIWMHVCIKNLIFFWIHCFIFQ